MSIPLPPPRERPRTPKRSSSRLLLECLRKRIANALHMGLHRSGDRLPSIRQLADELGADHRAVAKAYRSLEKEHLVVVRGRSGVYVADPLTSREKEEVPAEIASWMAGVLAEAWRRNLSASDLRELVEKCSDASRLSCACVESNLDQMTAYCAELSGLSGISTVRVYLPPGAQERIPNAQERTRLESLLEEADIVVTTYYHAATVRSLIGERTIPIVVLKIDRDLARAVRRRIARHGITLVAVTREFGDRMRLMYADAIERPEQLRVVLAGDAKAIRNLDPTEPILLTRAARRLCPELGARSLVFPHSPTIDRETLRELSDIVVRLNFDRVSAPLLEVR